jgi:hypothetical protein
MTSRHDDLEAILVAIHDLLDSLSDKLLIDEANLIICFHGNQG